MIKWHNVKKNPKGHSSQQNDQKLFRLLWMKKVIYSLSNMGLLDKAKVTNSDDRMDLDSESISIVFIS
jgi:hypothetical protein